MACFIKSFKILETPRTNVLKEMAKYIKKKGAGPHTLTAFESSDWCWRAGATRRRGRPRLLLCESSSSEIPSEL